MATSLKIRSLCCRLIRATATTLILVLLVSTQTFYSAPPPAAAAAARQLQWHMHASSLLPKAPSVVVAPNKYIVPAVEPRSSPLKASFFYPVRYRMMMRTRMTMTEESEYSPAAHSPGMGHNNPPSTLSSPSSSSIMPPPMRLDPRS